MAEIDNLEGSSLDTINDNSARWIMYGDALALWRGHDFVLA